MPTCARPLPPIGSRADAFRATHLWSLGVQPTVLPMSHKLGGYSQERGLYTCSCRLTWQHCSMLVPVYQSRRSERSTSMHLLASAWQRQPAVADMDYPIRVTTCGPFHAHGSHRLRSATSPLESHSWPRRSTRRFSAEAVATSPSSQGS